MPTFGTEALTLMDLHKRYKGSKDGIDSIIEVLNQANPIMQDLRYIRWLLPCYTFLQQCRRCRITRL